MDERMRSTAAAARVLTSISLSLSIISRPPVCVATCDRETAPAELSQNPKINKRVCVLSLTCILAQSGFPAHDNRAPTA